MDVYDRRIPNSNVVQASELNVHDEHNYSFGGNRVSTFALGAVGASDEFWLVGCLPDGESPHWPMITGNLLDSEGRQLCQVVRNQIRINPGECVISFQGIQGFKILDTKQEPILTVMTSFRNEENEARTMVTGDFYGKSGELVCCAEDDGVELAPGFGSAFGIVPSEVPGVGGCAFSMGLTEIQERSAIVAVQTHGRIHTTLEGTISDQKVSLDGCLLNRVHFKRCEIFIERGEYLPINPAFEDCRIAFGWPAMNVAQLVGQQAGHPIPTQPGNGASQPAK